MGSTKSRSGTKSGRRDTRVLPPKRLTYGDPKAGKTVFTETGRFTGPDAIVTDRRGQRLGLEHKTTASIFIPHLAQIYMDQDHNGTEALRMFNGDSEAHEQLHATTLSKEQRRAFKLRKREADEIERLLRCAYHVGHDHGQTEVRKALEAKIAAANNDERRLQLAERLTGSVAAVVDAMAHMMPYRQGNGSRP